LFKPSAPAIVGWSVYILARGNFYAQNDKVGVKKRVH